MQHRIEPRGDATPVLITRLMVVMLTPQSSASFA